MHIVKKKLSLDLGVSWPSVPSVALFVVAVDRHPFGSGTSGVRARARRAQTSSPVEDCETFAKKRQAEEAMHGSGPLSETKSNGLYCPSESERAYPPHYYSTKRG